VWRERRFASKAAEAEEGLSIGYLSIVMSTIRRIARSSLFVSEPDPRMFGNSRNEPELPGWTNKNWLKSRFHFSFAEWRDGPSRYGALRVLNDDLVQPRRGFGTHRHSDMEIVTLVVTGELSHADSMGSGETLGRGSIQYMSAGEGVNHSEQNAGAVPVRFIQSWVVPRTRGAEPVYGSLPDSEARRAARHNKWEHIGKEGSQFVFVLFFTRFRSGRPEGQGWGSDWHRRGLQLSSGRV
jgi:uncharacterized cupin superfamily protein